MRISAVTLAIALALVSSRLFAAEPALVSPGNVRLVKTANSSMDSYTNSPTQAQKSWLQAHYWRMVVYSPYFDSRLSWFPGGWVYKDLYAIYAGSSVASAHPDWILHDAGGHNLYIPFSCANGTCPQYAADVGNLAFRANWIAEATATLANGYRGLYIDDVNMLISRVSDGNGQPVVPIDPRTGKAMPESDWRRYMAEFTEQIRTAFPQKEIAHNALWFVGDSDPYVQRELVAADFIGLERGVNDSGIVHGTSTYGYETLLSFIDWLHQRSHSVWFDASAQTDQDREYGLASYFLVNTGTDALGGLAGATPGDWWSGYDVALGAAVGPRYAWKGVFRRDFNAGFVLVNEPGSPQVTVSLGGTYLDLTGAQRTSVTLGAGQGAVLRQPATTSAPTLLDVSPLQG